MDKYITNGTKVCSQLIARKTEQRHFQELLRRWQSNGDNGKRKEKHDEKPLR